MGIDVATKAKSKLEVLWQEFEKSGSVEAYLSYQQIKLTPAKAVKKEARPSLAAKSKR